MHVSLETPEQTQARLERLVAVAEWEVIAEPCAFVESGVSRFPAERVGSALAFVRDDQVWSALVPSEDEALERFRVFSFHFPAGLDNSGFVGWLASHLKARLGTGVWVICGQSSGRGGVFDYWGVPLEVGPQAIEEVTRLRRKRLEAP
jgi:hypothetical protein